MVANMTRPHRIGDELPEAERVDIEAWGGHPTRRARGKNVVFGDPDASCLSLELLHDEAVAMVATEPGARPAGHGHGRISPTVPQSGRDDWWDQLREWVRTSYPLIAPKTLVCVVLAEDAAPTTGGRA